MDTIGGVEPPQDGSIGFINGKLPTSVRYAQNITLKVKLDPSQNEKIYVPYLEIDYKDFRLDSLESYGGTTVNEEVIFISEYSMETDGFWNFAQVCFIVFMCIMAALILLRIFIVNRQARAK